MTNGRSGLSGGGLVAQRLDFLQLASSHFWFFFFLVKKAYYDRADHNCRECNKEFGLETMR